MSRITAARALTELQALNLPLAALEGKTKYFMYQGNMRDLYQMYREYFVNPVAKKLPLAKIPAGVCRRSGYSALADCSMSADNVYPTYGMTRQEYRNSEIDKYPIQPATDKPACIIQVLRYIIEQDGHIDPISAFLSLPDDEVSSLSAILLNDVYYQMLMDGRSEVEGLVILKPLYIIPFKAKAWLDLTDKMNKGVSVDEKDIRKHKNDIVRLAVVISGDDSVRFPEDVKADMEYFISQYEKEPADLKNLRIRNITNAEIIIRLKDIYIQ